MLTQQAPSTEVEQVLKSTRSAAVRTVRDGKPLGGDPLWFKDAIIYELHVKAFYDSNGDGIGDFPGLIEKLDYLQDLGINCVWLLPFYPSPQRDDGYDIADYRGVHPDYGTLRDFRQFVREAHRRGIRVVTELVINHTSNQHAWFQASRAAPAGSSARDFYVWSDNDQKYAQARIIFTDLEPSNWTWDPVAKAYYWHRFFHHQPDLNFDNPAVRRAVFTIFRYWLDMGVDGMRLDAVPYLMEREGTDCENLPETHAVLRELRQHLNEHYPECMLLAEANQWPADVRPYFGEGDECHMAFHFPLMPRIFMALRQEDRHAITEIMRQTPSIPDNCQWALFLRNHDELTLEKVTDVERDYMVKEYAADPRARLNLGIRRRLAPLMDHSRRRMELLTSLLFSLPGTPVIYYGDEIGMGDNLYLGDRNGVRTPMQWSSDRNAGFSRTDFARLYSAPIMDPVDGYQAVNVEAQQRDPSSLLNWMRQMIALRKRFQVFGRGSMQFLHPRNRKVLAYVRQNSDDVILAVANLSRFVQPVELDLSEFRGSTPVELLGRAEFPPIGELPYFLTLGPHSFYWLRLQRAESTARVTYSESPIDLPMLRVTAEWESLLNVNNRRLLEREILPSYLAIQRWFSVQDRVVRGTRISDWSIWPNGSTPTFLLLVDVEYSEGQTETYFLPLAVTASPAAEVLRQSSPQAIVARVITPQGDAVLHDALVDDGFCTGLWQAIEQQREFTTQFGKVRAFPTVGYAEVRGPTGDPLQVLRSDMHHSNFGARLGDRMMLKVFRRIEDGANPDLEIGRFLSERGEFRNIPQAAGGIEYSRPSGEPMTLVLLQSLVRHQGNGWDHTVDDVRRYFERAAAAATTIDPLDQSGRNWIERSEAEPSPQVQELIGSYLQAAATLGQRTAELHRALSGDTTNSAFAPEPMTSSDLVALSRSALKLTQEVFAAVDRNLGRLTDVVVEQAYGLLGQRSRLLRTLSDLAALRPDATKIRIHGDYHLNEVLWAENDFILLDFEGEASRPMAERRAKQSPLKDVAGMLRSFEYAVFEGLFAFTQDQPEEFERLEPWAKLWKRWTGAAFLRAYRATAGGAAFLPADRGQFLTLLRYFVLERALYELLQELNHRPEWVHIPLRGVLTLLDEERAMQGSH